MPTYLNGEIDCPEKCPTCKKTNCFYLKRINQNVSPLPANLKIICRKCGWEDTFLALLQMVRG